MREQGTGREVTATLCMEAEGTAEGMAGKPGAGTVHACMRACVRLRAWPSTRTCRESWTPQALNAPEQGLVWCLPELEVCMLGKRARLLMMCTLSMHGCGA